MYFGFYTCITELIHVFQILYMYFRSYAYLTEYVLVLRILFLYEGTRRYDESEQIRIISHRRSDHTSTDTEIIRS